MKTNRISIERNICIALALAVAAPLCAIPSPARAAELKEMSKEIIAVQIRKQGYACTNPVSATREGDATKYDDAVWLLKCDEATYKVQLIPDMAAKVERVP